MKPNPETDLVLERIVPASPERVWRAWTVPEQLVRWFTPAPWSTASVDIDLRPGGTFRPVMRSPEGDLSPVVGCYLEVVPNQRLVWTTALGAGFRPLPSTHAVPTFTAIIALEPHGTGTRYTATAMHVDPAGRQKHADLGFHDGWGAALDQLVALLARES